MPGDSYPCLRHPVYQTDGSPCNGKGLEQFDGYCIAHGPADQTRQWRALGGTNSSTAARLDKRIPARLKNMMECWRTACRVLEGTLSSADYTVILPPALRRIDLYRLADEEMEAIRAEETQTAAAEIAGAHGDLAILKAADDITAQQNQYRIDSLIDQDLATCDSPQTDGRPAEYVLTDEGRKRLGNRVQSPYTQEDIDELKDDVKSYTYEECELPELCLDLTEKRAVMEAALADLTRDPALDPAPPRDPLTGQTLNELPAGVSTGLPSYANSVDAVRSPEILQDQIRQVDEIINEVEKIIEDDQYEHKRSLFHDGIDPDSPDVQIITPRAQR